MIFGYDSVQSFQERIEAAQEDAGFNERFAAGAEPGQPVNLRRTYCVDLSSRLLFIRSGNRLSDLRGLGRRPSWSALRMSQPVSQNAHHRTDTDLLDRHIGLIPRVGAVQADVSDRFL